MRFPCGHGHELVADFKESRVWVLIPLKTYHVEALMQVKSIVAQIPKRWAYVTYLSTLSLEKTELLDKLRKLGESDLEKADKLTNLETKYENLQLKFKIIEKRLIETEIESALFKEKLLIINTRTESNDHPKTSISTKERESIHLKFKNKKLNSIGSRRTVHETSYSDENQAEEKNVLLRQINFLNSIILDTKLKEPNKTKEHIRHRLHICFKMWSTDETR
ncbi:hypothetical protein TNCV_1495651 [Trichonephila clavipes]|nr:hypothetical protein TNCV_1495651 [Trichonephila clavipes]